MRSGATAVAVLAFLAPGGAASGQTFEVPSAPGSWVLQVITQGGIMGTGAGDFVVSSDGRLSCLIVKAQCAPEVRRDVLRSLEREVRAALPEAWLVFPPNTMCRDCLTTTLVLTSRNADGTLQVMRAAWDPTTRAKLAGAIVNLHDLTMKAAQPLTR